MITSTITSEVPTTVLIADDRPEIREVLSALVSAENGLRLVGVASDADQAIALAREHRPDVALVDVKMPGGGGPRAAREIRLCSPETRIVALSAYEDRGSVFEMLRAGAVGYLVKGASAGEIRETIVRLARGESVLSAEVTGEVVHELAEQLERQSTQEELERERLERVRRALAAGALRVAFQPIVELSSGRPVGFEGLARFPGEAGISPAGLFAEAALAGLQTELELAALRAALGQVERLPSRAFVAVNVSPRVLLARTVLDTLSEAPTERLVIETTEHAPVDDYDALRKALRDIRSRGTRLAVDDAGAGFASLRHVLELSPDMIKIDGTLVREIENDRAARALTSALVTFALEMDQVVIAEGIESKRTVYLLEALGVRYGQGFYIGRPGELPNGR